MITLEGVKDWLKSFGIAENYYIGKLDAKKEKSIGVYPLKRNGPPVTAIGSKSTYDIKSISVLIHWTKYANETETAALQLYEKLRRITHTQINGTHIHCLQLITPEPVGVGTDESGVYEYVIEFNLYYERNE